QQARAPRPHPAPGPGARAVRAAPSLLGDDVWICVTVPGGFEGAEGDPAPGEDVIRQWTSVVTDAGELRWLKEMLALNAAGDEAGGLPARALLEVPTPDNGSGPGGHAPD